MTFMSLFQVCKTYRSFTNLEQRHETYLSGMSMRKNNVKVVYYYNSKQSNQVSVFGGTSVITV